MPLNQARSQTGAVGAISPSVQSEAPEVAMRLAEGAIAPSAAVWLRACLEYLNKNWWWGIVVLATVPTPVLPRSPAYVHHNIIRRQSNTRLCHAHAGRRLLCLAGWPGRVCISSAAAPGRECSCTRGRRLLIAARYRRTGRPPSAGHGRSQLVQLAADGGRRGALTPTRPGMCSVD